MSEVMGVAAKREEQQARYESLAHTRPDDRDQTGTTRLEAMKLINSKILDYKHEHPANLRKTIELLLKLCQNICDAPEDPRFRKVACFSLRYRVKNINNKNLAYAVMLHACVLGDQSHGVPDTREECRFRSINSTEHKCYKADVSVWVAHRH